MGEIGQTTKNVNLGHVAREALIARGHITRESFEPPRVAIEVPPIPKEDERDLQWYFAEERHDSVSLGGGSNFNAMLERMELLSKVARACVDCGGVREVLDEEGRVIVEEQGGSGFVTGSKAFREYVRMGKICRVPYSRKAWVDANAQGDMTCSKCQGKGWKLGARRDSKRKPTVRITGQMPRSISATKASGGDASLARLGMVGRKRAAVRQADPLAEAALESFYSPDGGNEEALWWLTPAGQELLEANHRGVPHQAFFRTLKRHQAATPCPMTERRLRVAREQAHRLRARMNRAWLESAA